MPRRTRTTDPTLVVGYCRTSTTDQRNSIDAQPDAIERYSTTHGLHVVASYEDRGVSGSKPAMERAGLSSAIDALAQHRAGGLIVAKRDRFGRDVVEVGLAVRLVERLGATVLTADGTGNGDGPEPALLRGVVDLFAQYERAVIRARTRAALRARRDRGLKFTKWSPFGFRWDRHRRMVDDAEQQQTLKRMRTLRRRGMSYRAVAGRFDREGRGPARASAWSVGMVGTLCLRASS